MRKIVIALSAIYLLTSCATHKRTATGAGIGVAAGAAAGAILAGKGSEGKGAVIGGLLGGLIGGGVGAYLDKQAKELEQIAETKRTDDGIITKLKGDITFDVGKAEVTPEAKQRIAQLAAVIKKYPEDVLTVVGHTDSTGSSVTNQTLSDARASVVKGLLATNGVPAATISSLGMGPNQPIASNDTANGRAQNRRVEIQITVDESKLKN
ncbi:MAG: OmpA family protein [Halobacteriovoraceae bacterium]|nr:OmpA family protein [Halobacteriovoraceae bacterium]